MTLSFESYVNFQTPSVRKKSATDPFFLNRVSITNKVNFIKDFSKSKFFNIVHFFQQSSIDEKCLRL